MKIKRLIESILISLVCLRIFAYFLPIELTNVDLHVYIQIATNCLIALCICLYILGIIFDKATELNLFLKLFTSLAVIACCGIVIVILFFGGIMCHDVDAHVYYKSKNGNSEIKAKAFDCGATTAISSSDYKLVKITALGKYVQWVTRIDTTTIEKGEWVKL